MRRAVTGVVLGVIACSTETPQIAETDTLAVTDTVIDWRTADLPPYPEYPGRRGGRLAGRGVGGTTFDGVWRARAVRCTMPERLLLIAEDETGGASVLFELPSADTVLGAYPVHAGDPRDVPDAPAANVGFQFFEDFGASAYQASAGTVRVSRLDDHVSGRFRVEIMHIQTDERARVSGTFDNVDVDSAPASLCVRAGEHADSVVTEREQS